MAEIVSDTWPIGAEGIIGQDSRRAALMQVKSPTARAHLTLKIAHSACNENVSKAARIAIFRGAIKSLLGRAATTTAIAGPGGAAPGPAGENET